MEAAHIIPSLLNKFEDEDIMNLQIVRNVCPFILMFHAHFCGQRDSWDMLQLWTQIDLKALVGQNINSPMNAIYMSREEHSNFVNFGFYLDKEAVSC